VTHDPEEAMANADRILLMNKGRIEQLDSPMGIFDTPKNRFVAEFFQNSNILVGLVENCEGETVTIANEFGRFRARARDAIPPLNEKVNIVIRHDKARLGTGKEAVNRVEGIVVGEEIVGAVITYNVRLNLDMEFKFQTHMSLNMPRIEPNEKISLTWDTDDASLLL
jgi:ABC-type Fe3+/spermidine/putrescine transport system ATPase subunit